MAISASMVKELRDKTGAGMMDCKNALNENDGDIVELNSETDFVARNEAFQAMVSGVAKAALGTDGSNDALNAADLGGKSVADTITGNIATIGENMSLRRAAVMEVSNGAVSSYIHNAISDGLGKIGVLVALESTGEAAAVAAIGRQVAMHVAATNPLAATKDDMDQELVEREKAIFTESARESGKPENIIEKMVEGRIRKFYEENVLLSQTFVIDGENTVEQALKNAEADAGAPITLKGFTRFQLGEGIEKEEDDFAAEVASMAGN